MRATNPSSRILNLVGIFRAINIIVIDARTLLEDAERVVRANIM